MSGFHSVGHSYLPYGMGFAAGAVCFGLHAAFIQLLLERAKDAALED